MIETSAAPAVFALQPARQKHQRDPSHLENERVGGWKGDLLSRYRLREGALLD